MRRHGGGDCGGHGGRGRGGRGGCDRRGRGGEAQLEREAHNEAARNVVLQGVAEAPVQLGDHLMEDVDKEENEPQILFDHVNEEALGELATREVSKVFRLSNGSGPTLLRAAEDLLVQCGRNRLPCGARAYKTVYFEESLMVVLDRLRMRCRKMEWTRIVTPPASQSLHF